MESRLKRRSLRHSKKQLYGSLIGIVILLFVALNFGPYLISILGGAIDTITGKSGQTGTIKSSSILVPPSLDPLPRATQNDFIDVTGRSFYQNADVELFVNNSKYESAPISEDLDFEIKDVKLKLGENSLKVRIMRGDLKSEFSQDYKISYVKNEPKLEIETPSSGASFLRADQEITVRGKTDPDNTVRINDFIAIVDSDGNFSYVYKLKEGENKLTITAQNSAGKTKDAELTVSYSP